MNLTDAEKTEYENIKKEVQSSKTVQLFERETDPLKAADNLMALKPMPACAFLDLVHPLIGNTVLEVIYNRAFAGNHEAQKVYEMAKAFEVKASQVGEKIANDRQCLIQEATRAER